MIANTNAAYIHIPFCRRRCYYCDFPITVIGDRASEKFDRTQVMKAYVQALCQEIRLTATLYPSAKLETVFFGGGTPSLLPTIELEKILITLEEALGISQDAEISIEIDPGTFDLPQLQAYQSLGINRYSLGVQAFQDDLLASLGRTHRLEEIDRAIAQFEQVGITNFSLDLISGLPQQSLSQWEETLDKAIQTSPAHLSCYDLIVEPGTAFERQREKGKLPLPPDESSAEMYRLTQQRLTDAGYTHYEISNYALDGYQCRHNRIYWQNLPFYGFGMGATSYLGGKRYARSRTRREYYTWVETLTETPNDLIPTPPIDPIDQLLETLMLGLRLKEGVNLSAIAKQFGAETVNQLIDTLQPDLDQQWVEITPDDHLQLTDPEGLLFSNTILTKLFSVFSG
ncbi:MAG: radical SAM family heme chaperone HemW [Halothece sp.]